MNLAIRGGDPVYLNPNIWVTESQPHGPVADSSQLEAGRTFFLWARVRNEGILPLVIDNTLMHPQTPSYEQIMLQLSGTSVKQELYLPQMGAHSLGVATQKYLPMAPEMC